MRRASVIGPLILIGLGVLFLINNFWPSISIPELLANFWPYILIGWGVLRLAEIVYWQMRGRALPLQGMSGGEWTLIVFFSIFAASTAEVRNHWPGFRFAARSVEVFGESYDYPLEGKSPAGAKFNRILVENLRGNCRISGSDTATGATITGRKSIRAFKQAEADESNKLTPLEFNVTGDQLVIRTNQDRASGDRRVSIDLEITVPKGVSVETRGRYGDFEINDITGSVDVNSDNAGVRLQNVGGSVKVDLRRSDIIRAVNVKGPVELKGRGADVELENIEGLVTITGGYSGEVNLRNLAKPLRYDGDSHAVHVEKLPGQMRVSLGHVSGSNIVGPIQLKGRSRDVELSDFTQGLEVTVDRGDIELRPGRLPLARMDVRTRNGNIDLAIPNGAKFEVKATTSRGEVENDYGDVLKSRTEGRGQTLTGAVGAGPALTLETDRGSVIVRKGDLSTVTSEAPPAGPSRVPPAPPKSPAPPPAPLPKADNQ